MTQPARLSPEFADDLLRAREDTQALWRQLMIDVDRIGTNAPLALAIKGRYLAGDASEFDCVLTEISPVGLRLEGPWPVALGMWCAANFADIGIVEGFVVDSAPTSFRLGVVAPSPRLQRLAQRLAWSLRRTSDAVEERRQSERVEMKHAGAILKTSDGREIPCQVFDLSEGGAALHVGSASLYFWVDQQVVLNDRSGRVLRYFPGGLVIKFDAIGSDE